MMCVEVRALEVTKRDIAILQREFEWLDADFDGRHLFSEFLQRMREGARHIPPPGAITNAGTASGPNSPSAQNAAAAASGTASSASSAAVGATSSAFFPSSSSAPALGTSAAAAAAAAAASASSPSNSSLTGRAASASSSTRPKGAAASTLADLTQSLVIPASSGQAPLPKAYARDYVPTRAIYAYADNRVLGFADTVTELFTRSHPHMISDIRRWAASMPVPALTDKQHVELEQLFEIYDLDGSGTSTCTTTTTINIRAHAKCTLHLTHVLALSHRC
jgi:hypothetical protein